MLINGTNPQFVALLAGHEMRRAAARDSLLRYVGGRGPAAAAGSYSPLAEQLQELLASHAATQVLGWAVDRQLALIRAKEEEVRQYREAAVACEDAKERVRLTQKAVDAFNELGELVAALEDVAEA